MAQKLGTIASGYRRGCLSGNTHGVVHAVVGTCRSRGNVIGFGREYMLPVTKRNLHIKRVEPALKSTGTAAEFPALCTPRTQSKRNITIIVMLHCVKGSARNLNARFLTLVPPPPFVRIR
jgi:hypothetical protein